MKPRIKPSFSQNRFNEVTDPVTIKPEIKNLDLKIAIIACMILFLLTLVRIWLY